MLDHTDAGGFGPSCVYCKAPDGIHDGLCGSCMGRITGGAPVAPRRTEAGVDAAREAADRLEADEWRRGQERLEFLEKN